MVNAARLKDSGERNDVAAGMAKYLASEYCTEVTQQSFRIHGGYGYSKEYEIERLMRDAPFLLIGEGTSEIQKSIISKRLLAEYGFTVTVPDFAARPQLSEDVARLSVSGSSMAPTSRVLRPPGPIGRRIGISVTPVRKRSSIARRGAARPTAATGFVVLPVTQRDLADVANVQAHVGGELAARAAVNIDDDQLRELKQSRRNSKKPMPVMNRANGASQPRIPPGHQRGRGVAKARADHVADHPLRAGIDFPTIPGGRRQSIKDHRRMVAALAKHDRELARKAMSDHLAAAPSH